MDSVGANDGTLDGIRDGIAVGVSVGNEDGAMYSVGENDATLDGMRDGTTVGVSVGKLWVELQIISLSNPQPVPLVQSPLNSSTVHNLAPILLQARLASW